MGPFRQALHRRRWKRDQAGANALQLCATETDLETGQTRAAAGILSGSLTTGRNGHPIYPPFDILPPMI